MGGGSSLGGAIDGSRKSGFNDAGMHDGGGGHCGRCGVLAKNGRAKGRR